MVLEIETKVILCWWIFIETTAFVTEPRGQRVGVVYSLGFERLTNHYATQLLHVLGGFTILMFAEPNTWFLYSQKPCRFKKYSVLRAKKQTSEFGQKQPQTNIWKRQGPNWTAEKICLGADKKKKTDLYTVGVISEQEPAEMISN